MRRHPSARPAGAPPARSRRGPASGAGAVRARLPATSGCPGGARWPRAPKACSAKCSSGTTSSAKGREYPGNPGSTAPPRLTRAGPSDHRRSPGRRLAPPMTVAERLDPFVGRAAEVATLRAELAAARAGTPRVLVVQGDAGHRQDGAPRAVPHRRDGPHGAPRHRRAVGGLRRLRRDRPDHARGRASAPRGCWSAATGRSRPRSRSASGPGSWTCSRTWRRSPRSW